MANVKEEEWSCKMKLEREQLEAEKKVLNADQRDLSHRMNNLYREEALLKAERIRLQEKQKEVETATAIFQKEELDLEQKYCSIAAMREDACKLFLKLTSQSLSENKQIS